MQTESVEQPALAFTLPDESEQEDWLYEPTITAAPWIVLAALCGTAMCSLLVAGDPHSKRYLLALSGLWLAVIGIATTSGVSNALWWKRRRPAPDEPEGASETDELFARVKAIRSREAKHSQAVRTGLAWFAAFLSPLAVLSLAIQIAWQKEHGWAYFFISLELIILVVALLTVYGGSPFTTQHDKWIPARLRVQLLKRELWLYRCRVGPYLECKPDEVVSLFRVRMAVIGNDDPAPLLQMRGERTAWISELQQSPVVANRFTVDDIRRYVTWRIRHQNMFYFRPSLRKHERNDRAYENTIRLSLVIAAVLALFHLLSLHWSVASKMLVSPLVDISALVMPTFGAACVTLRALFENHRLSHSYFDAAEQLKHHESEFDGLLTDWHIEGADRSKLAREFQSHVLQTEADLAAETRRWWLIVAPERQAMGP